MLKEQAIAILQGHQAELLRLGVREAYLFGSVVRGDARADSDVDVLVELDHTPTLFELARLRASMERWFGRSVDLGLKDSVRPALRARILGEAVRAA